MRCALFLDRDGVINVDRDYVHRIEDFKFQAGIFDLVRTAASAGFSPVVVTNQSGIGRGYYSEEDFDRLTQWMCDRFAEQGAPIVRVYHCPHHPDALHPELRGAHPWRKPEPGMLLAARDDLGIELARSILIGDQWTDAAAAIAAGVPRILIVGEPRGERPDGMQHVVRVRDIPKAQEFLNLRTGCGSDDADRVRRL